ncbi:proteasome activator complex subunit 3 [Tieghemostelium lacteum]|uniref:Proteasome activator complex subunit 3 n=1 Tax=Tieghemostelium lacteum TaxID=361077 RepID=A0A151ZER1_TIELA|nr:proteasome activator complex subunit 3 [Tieghemostelium lacteum]|eukprot:KYQ92384.1 proteasome activator complex subunit 3 [Tieghemostelium lacteum]
MKFDDRVLQYKNDLLEKAIYHLKYTIPKKIAEFQKLSENKINNITPEVSQDTHLKKRKLEGNAVDNIAIDDLVNVNTSIVESHKKLQHHYIEIIDTFSVIRAWLSLNVPKIEDGNNFGVDIQEDVIGQLSKLEDLYSGLLEQSEHYYLTRAEAVKKALKHKNIDAYKYAVLQLDEKESMRSHFAYFDLANNYATSYSLIIKNFQKLEAPRNSHQSSLF